MESLQELFLLGLSHRTAPIEVRERCALGRAAIPARLSALRGGTVEECWLLSTCNRTEVLAVAKEPEGEARRLRQELFGAAVPESSLYLHRGVEAVFHVFRVAGGLDSQVLGESQILAQLKDASAAAREAGSLGPLLQSLLDHALGAGKRVRSDTRVGEGTLSVAKAAVDLARRVFGGFASVRALILGAGETGLLAARHLRDEGCRSLAFANRTRERAEEAARSLGGEARPIESLATWLADMDLTIVSVDGTEPLVRGAHLDPGRLRRHDRPPVMIDLSVPRAVDPDLKSHPNLLVHDLDDLESIVARHRHEREAEVELAGRILVEETHKWVTVRTYAAFKPAITGLVDRFEAIRRDVLKAHGVPGADLEEFSAKLMRRFLDEALGTLKEGARQALPEEQLGRRYRNWLEKS